MYQPKVPFRWNKTPINYPLLPYAKIVNKSCLPCLWSFTEFSDLLGLVFFFFLLLCFGWLTCRRIPFSSILPRNFVYTFDVIRQSTSGSCFDAKLRQFSSTQCADANFCQYDLKSYWKLKYGSPPFNQTLI